jgi:hypothetical protein
MRSNVSWLVRGIGDSQVLALYAVRGMVCGEHADLTSFKLWLGVSIFVLAAESEELDGAFPEIVDNGEASIVVHPVEMRRLVSSLAVHLPILDHFGLVSKEAALSELGGG